MNNLSATSKNCKHKFTRTNLTVAKKSKKYWDSLVSNEGINDRFLDNIKNEVNNYEAETSTVYSSSSQESTLHDTLNVLETNKLSRSFGIQTKRNKLRSFGIQSLCQSKSKSMQMKGNQKCVSSSSHT